MWVIFFFRRSAASTLNVILIISSTFRPIIRSYLHVGESKTSALMSPMLLLENSGNLTCDSITDSLLLKFPLVVVVCFGVPLVVSIPKGKHYLFIMVWVLPESNSTISDL